MILHVFHVIVRLLLPTLYTDNALQSALTSVLTDADFDLPTQPAIDARKSATCALSWCDSHKEEASSFLTKIQQQLNTCFVQHKKFTTQKEKMWELYFKQRSTSNFEDMWKDFLTKSCEIEASPTLYQHIITDLLFNSMISENFQ